MIETNMKRKLGILFVFIGFITIIIVGFRFYLSTRTPKTGVLKIHSNPPASIFLDNVHKGRTPYEAKVDVGDYTIKLVPETTVQQLASWQGKIQIAPNLLTYVNRDLTELEISSAGEVLWLEKITSKQSELAVTTIPDGATVILDDQTRGIAPLTLTDVTPGDHSLVLTSPGFMSRTLKVRTTVGYKLNASIQLALSPLGNTVEPTPEASPTSKIENKNDDKKEDSLSTTPTPTEKSVSPTPTELPDPEKPFIIINDTPTGFLRVRESSTTGSEEVSKVDPGDKFTILDTENGWHKILFDGEQEGWVSGKYTEVVE
ncbi:PEGA domain-containing protein [Patescibacteria group bacterium]